MTREIYNRSWGAYLLLLPTLVVSLVFLYYPAIRAAHLSLFETLRFGSVRVWTGLGNYQYLLTSSEYHSSIGITVLFSAIVIVGVMTISLVISYLIYEVSVGQSSYLIAAIWPYALPPAVAGIVFFYIIHPSLGVLTTPIEAVTGINVDWFTSGRQAFVIVTVAVIWKQIGYNVIFMIAALNNVPDALGEVADLDGVGKTTRLVRVYMPLISPTLIFLAVMNTIYAFFSTFAFIDVLTQGGPSGATNIMIYDLYRNAFEFNNHGLASAQSVILFLIVGILMYAQLRFSDRYAHYG
ncbi:carbohydrate ABC transporter permease [Natronosalvus rutilus]|uniref:sn-glycerol-3-phosphate transport system permease protein UgpA n=1 Tax=Natronosalvus rutilus TaxID=2953753 RepID=A0A9E7NB71_9EURY|nr:sugar ABC transporter permease [Natronosalvus rutilus]UTF54201.1 sugar ABC transporter permease [Natronosalvus rutilus]